jgi:hypothetical protein
MADHEAISEIEDRALTEIAAALIVDKAALMQTAAVRPMPGQSVSA